MVYQLLGMLAFGGHEGIMELIKIEDLLVKNIKIRYHLVGNHQGIRVNISHTKCLRRLAKITSSFVSSRYTPFSFSVCPDCDVFEFRSTLFETNVFVKDR